MCLEGHGRFWGHFVWIFVCSFFFHRSDRGTVIQIYRGAGAGAGARARMHGPARAAVDRGRARLARPRRGAAVDRAAYEQAAYVAGGAPEVREGLGLFADWAVWAV
jgi:hypothetical protein